MIKDITIVSLSSGVVGEPFVQHEVRIGLRRLEAYGIHAHFSRHALCGVSFLQAHPEKRAEDLLDAFQSDTDMILCAIGGVDSYRMLPYLFDHDELQRAVSKKVFLGFSDATMIHLMLHKVGLDSFYGQAFLPDICELDNEMIPYTRQYFEELVRTGTISRIVPSDVWYEARKDFSESSIGKPMPQHANQGFEVLQGSPVFRGKILGGCIDTLFDIFNNERHADSVAMGGRYQLFPRLDDWKGKILLLETSENQPVPAEYHRMVEALKQTGVFRVVSGVLAGKPQDDTYATEYKRILKEVVNDPVLPIVTNINVGHASPRCIIPFGVDAVVDADKQEITFAG
ncbi:MAG: LD-carboxypeptidase [Sphaerochaetaceae bacterium]|nr:LD-carboxypeptidase [Spirochaetales bacterium]MDY5500486.1 LD-carboxypeptidase [Sphaerochaetaceae bacterium]